MKMNFINPCSLSVFILVSILFFNGSCALVQENKKSGYYTATESKLLKTEPLFKVTLSPIDSANLKFKVVIENEGGNQISVRISSYNNSLFSDTFIGKYYAQIYDLSALDDGSYFFEARCGKERFKQKIEINTVNTREIKYPQTLPTNRDKL